MNFLNEHVFFIHIIVLFFASIFNLSLSFLFSLIETSLIITDDIKFHALIMNTKNESKKAKLSKILSKRDKYGASLSVAITLTNVTGSSILGSMASNYLNKSGVIIFTILITYLMLVFARTVPKIYARKVNKETLVKYVSLIHGVYLLCIPILWFTLIWVKILKLNKNKKAPTISELKDIVSVYKKNGVLNHSEETIFENLFDVREARVESLVKKKKDIIKLSAGKTLEQSRNIILKTFSKKMIVINAKNEIIGVVSHYQLIQSLMNGEGHKKVSDFIKKCQIINEYDKIIEAISKLNNKKSQAVIVDENDNPVGIVSMKDMYFFLTGKKSKTKK